MEKLYLENLAEEGLSQKEIALKSDCSATTVRYWLKKYGLKTKYRTRRLPIPYRCTECGEDDPKKFYGIRKSMCKTCAKLDMAKRLKTRKYEAVRRLGGKCERCGYDKCVAALEFHHTDPTQKDPSSQRMRQWSIDRQMAELSKCILLCSNCHREEHWMQYETDQ